MDQMKPEQEHQLRTEMERSRQAQELIEHPLFREALDLYKARLAQEWESSPARDTEGRERIWLMNKVAGAVEKHLLEIMETGHLASLQMEQHRNWLQRVRDWTS